VLALKALDRGRRESIELVRPLDVSLVEVLCIIVTESARKELPALVAALLARSPIVLAPVLRLHWLLGFLLVFLRRLFRLVFYFFLDFSFLICSFLLVFLRRLFRLVFYFFLDFSFLICSFLLVFLLVLPVIFPCFFSFLEFLSLWRLLLRSIILRFVIIWWPFWRIYITVRVSEDVSVVLDGCETGL